MRALVLLAAFVLAACSDPTAANYPDVVAASLKRCAYIPAPDAAREIIKKSSGKSSKAIAGDICLVIEGSGPPNVADVPLQGFKVR